MTFLKIIHFLSLTTFHFGTETLLLEYTHALHSPFNCLGWERVGRLGIYANQQFYQMVHALSTFLNLLDNQNFQMFLEMGLRYFFLSFFYFQVHEDFRLTGAILIVKPHL